MEGANLDVVLSVTVPFTVYWIAAIAYELIASVHTPWVDKLRIHAAKDEVHNRVSRKRVVLTVLAEHALQVFLGILTLEHGQDFSERSLWGECIRFVGAALCLDAWQFAFHRLFHEVEWLYTHVHSWHHRIFVPYPMGALYQHPLEMLIMDTLSGLVAVTATGCAPRTAMCFWSFAYFKTVSDHSGLVFPLNPLNWRGCNGAAYHDVHHAPTGVRLNYSQPFFTFWDRIYGSFKDPYERTPLSKKKLL